MFFHLLRATCFLVSLHVLTARAAAITASRPSNSSLTWPAAGQTFTVPDRDDMKLIFEDLPSAMDEGRGVAAIDIFNSAQTYIDQLKLKAANPFRGMNFPIGNSGSGELDCRVTGTVYVLRPVISPAKTDWDFSIRDAIDTLRGVQDAANIKGGLEESDVQVVVEEKLVARLRILDQFRGGQPSGEKCLDHQTLSTVEEVAAS